MSLLAGLDKLGLKNLESMDLYEDKDAAEQQKAAEAKSKVPEVKETDFLFQKTYECPVCGSKFHDVTVKANRARLLRTEMDLRPVFEGIEPLKYEAILCPTCGYTALGRYFNNVTAAQAKAIRENISAVFHGSPGKSICLCPVSGSTSPAPACAALGTSSIANAWRPCGSPYSSGRHSYLQ